METTTTISDEVSRATGNLFLDDLSDAAWRLLERSLQRVQLKSGVTVHAPHELIREVFFPIASIVSIVSEMSGHKTLEIGIIGREGLTGVAIALGQQTNAYRHVVQLSDSSLKVPVKVFRAAFQQDEELNASLLRYAQATWVATAQSAACNRAHGINERCARWLLMAHDRVDGDRIALTQIFLSQMLGVRRAGVTEAAVALQDAGLIEYSRGHIIVRDRKLLEAAACECYRTLERNWSTIMGYSPSKSLTSASRRKVRRAS